MQPSTIKPVQQDSQQVHDKQRIVQQRIEHLIGKTKAKMKLGMNQKEDKFNERLSALRSVNTFVDIHAQLQAMNMIEDPAFLKQLKNHRDKLLQQLEIDQELQRREIQKQNLEVYEHMNHHQLAVQTISEEDVNAKLKTPLRMIQVNSSLAQVKVQVTQSQTFLHACDLIRRSKSRYKSVQHNVDQGKLINEDAIYEQLQDDQELQNHQETHYNEGLEFYTDMLNNFNRRQFLKMKRQEDTQKKILNVREELARLDDFLSQNGIDLESKNIVPNQNFFKNYHEKAQQMIRKAESVSKRHASTMKIIPLTPNQEMLQSETQRLVKINRELFRRHRERTRGRVESPKSLRVIEPSSAKPGLVTLIETARHPSERPIRFARKLLPFDEAKNMCSDFSSKLNRAQSELLASNQPATKQLQIMNEEIVNSQNKYPQKMISSLRVDSETMSSYLKLTQKLRQSNLFRKKSDQQQVLRKQKIQKHHHY